MRLIIPLLNTWILLALFLSIVFSAEADSASSHEGPHDSISEKISLSKGFAAIASELRLTLGALFVLLFLVAIVGFIIALLMDSFLKWLTGLTVLYSLIQMIFMFLPQKALALASLFIIWSLVCDSLYVIGFVLLFYTISRYRQQALTVEQNPIVFGGFREVLSFIFTSKSGVSLIISIIIVNVFLFFGSFLRFSNDMDLRVFFIVKIFHLLFSGIVWTLFSVFSIIYPENFFSLISLSFFPLLRTATVFVELIEKQQLGIGTRNAGATWTVLYFFTDYLPFLAFAIGALVKRNAFLIGKSLEQFSGPINVTSEAEKYSELDKGLLLKDQHSSEL